MLSTILKKIAQFKCQIHQSISSSQCSKLLRPFVFVGYCLNSAAILHILYIYVHIFVRISLISATFVSVHCRVIIKSIYFPRMSKKIPIPATVYCCKKYVNEMNDGGKAGSG